MVTVDDFTVAWICQLQLELVAAISLLDERYEDLPTHSIDPNAFTVLGRIAQHRVVIACPPAGGYGEVSAAAVVSNLLLTFRNINLALLVGLGGGAPSGTHDIRLGDIVVGQPGRDHGGVIQYDFGKQISSGQYHIAGSLVKPPRILLSALAQVQARHMISQATYVDYLSALSTDDNELEYPGDPFDNLYRNDYVHPPGHGDCSNCDPKALVARSPRASTAPRVHYGLIACGNAVLKNGKIRDKLSQESGILCFYMETEGLMDKFPSLVIRGIADYSDSHPNKVWHRYAAATAAAYAKELLHCVHPDGDSLGMDEGAGADADNVTTSSATLISDSDSELINKAAGKVADAFLSDKRLNALCTACIPRMTASRFQNSIIKILSNFGARMKKSAGTPLGQSVAFITRHRKELISWIIRERLYPSGSETGGGRLGKLSKEETARLKQLIETRFPSPQHRESHRAHPSNVESEQKGEERDPETDITDMPAPLTEADLENITQTVCTGEPYWEAYKELKLAAFPAASQELARELRNRILDNGSLHVVNCMIQWEILEFMESEKVTETNLDSCLTLTGTFDRALVCRLGDYMNQQ
ncbi:nucleoside phosphorylase domain-containing protein [Aspergillus egyptiacus]|nr:nucleoside phosphorylase domain-containing protein [Aspergillus egyptiacus]